MENKIKLLESEVFEASELQKMQSEVAKQMIRIEEDCINGVLRQVLKREPTIEDYKECTQSYKEGEDDGYYIAYKGVNLGRITRAFSSFGYSGDAPKYKVTFTPPPL